MSYNDLRRGRVSIVQQEYFITCVVKARSPVFGDFTSCRTLIKEMMKLESDGLVRWLAWVIMPDHFHGLLSLQKGQLSESIQLLKGRSARKISAQHKLPGSLWQPGFHDHALRSEEDRIAIARYIVANPLRAGLVSDLGHYPHWDAVWL